MKLDEDLKILIGLIILSITFLLIGFFGGIKEAKKDQCTKVRAYIPINGKWLEKDICLEGLK